jgi:hypothetical protein
VEEHRTLPIRCQTEPKPAAFGTMATMDPQPVIGIIGMGDVSSVQNFYLRLAGDGRNVADPVARWARCTLGD